MSWSTRRASIVVAILALFGALPTVLAQVKEAVPIQIGGRRPIRPMPPTTAPTGDPTDLGGITLTPDEALQKSLQDKIQRAKDNMDPKVENWQEAVDALQNLLDRVDDVNIVIEREVDGKTTKSLASVRTEAERLVANLPPKGMDFYKVTYGPEADRDFKSGSDDPVVLTKLVRRFLYTDAGAQAAERLASYHLDRGRYGQAAGYFKRLFERQGPDKLSVETLFKSALAFHHAGETFKTSLDKAWEQIEGKTSEITLGGKAHAVADLREWLGQRKTIAMRRERGDWLMVGGGYTRADQGDGTTAFLEARWKVDLFREQTTKGHIDKALEYLRQVKQPELHSFSPLAVTVRREDGGKVPLVVFKSHWGVHAHVVRDLKVGDEEYKAGELYWEAPSQWSVDKMVRSAQHVSALSSWLNLYVNPPSRLRPSVLFENSVTGSLSSDNTRVYLVEDFQVPPAPTGTPYNRGMAVPGTGTYEQKLNDALYHSRLQAIDLDSGKLLWEVGAKGDDKAKDPLADTYFLGPPLPLGGKLYVLGERNQELRLITLEPATGSVIGKPQRLADAREKILTDVNRRIHAAHMAYGEGLLVCPTNSGGILGIDLLTGSLAWAYGYREKGSFTHVTSDPKFGQPPAGYVYLPDGRLVPALTIGSNWKLTPPIIAQGKVVFTAPDAASIHCLNLRDGSRAWRNTRQEGDLYLAGVFAGKVLIVGRSYARILSLADGTEIARLETGTPSGVGVASKDVYYLPLKMGTKSREPEICLIDMANDRIKAHTRSRKKPNQPQEIPGNLLFYEGDVISQGLTELAVYPQLEVELGRIDTLLAKNLDDPEGRARRGDLRLDKGDLGGAIEDLQVALRQEEKLPKDLASKAKNKLYESMREYFQTDFDGAEKYLKDFEAMCKVPGAGISEAERKAEEKRRKGDFYCLIGKGREAQALKSTGKNAQQKLIEAFDAYMRFGELGSDQELMSVVDDVGVRASPSVWSRGRIAAMVAKASKEVREPLEAKIGERWKEIKDGSDVDAMRGFVSTFGAFSTVGREARLQLAERLIGDADAKAILEAERHLHILRLHGEDRTMAARAVEALARLMTRHGLMEDATHYYRVLGRDFADVKVRDGKTGRDYFNELATDKRLLAYLDEPLPLAGAKLSHDAVREENGYFQFNGMPFKLEQEGEAIPYFRRHMLSLRTDFLQLRVSDRETDAEVWPHNLGTQGLQYFQQYVAKNQPPQGRQPNQAVASPRFSFRNLGHLVVLQVGHVVYAFDPINKKPLWEKSLASSAAPAMTNFIVDPRDGSTQILYSDGWTTRLAATGPVSPLAVCLMTTDALVAVDPVSGQVLWTRSDMPRRSHLSNDGEHVFVVEVAQDGTAGGARAFRLHDGVDVRVKDFSTAYQKRIRMQGRNILYADQDGRKTVLRLYDVIEGKDRWTLEGGPKAHVLVSEDEALAGMVEPDGKLTVVDLTTQKPLLESKMDPKHLENAVSVAVLRDGKYVYVAVNGPPDNKVQINSLVSNLLPGSGLRALPVNGKLYCFDPARPEEEHWWADAENQMVVLDDFAELPMVLMTSRYQQWDQFRTNLTYVVSVKSYDKRTGKILYSGGDNTGQFQQFHTLKLDPRGRKVELVSYNRKLVHYLDGASAARDGAKDGPGGPMSRPGTGPGGPPGGFGPGAAPPPPGIRRLRGGLQKQGFAPKMIGD